jgi:hypothetical protein
MLSLFFSIAAGAFFVALVVLRSTGEGGAFFVPTRDALELLPGSAGTASLSDDGTASLTNGGVAFRTGEATGALIEGAGVGAVTTAGGFDTDPGAGVALLVVSCGLLENGSKNTYASKARTPRTSRLAITSASVDGGFAATGVYPPTR